MPEQYENLCNINNQYILKQWIALNTRSDCLVKSEYPVLFTCQQLGKKFPLCSQMPTVFYHSVVQGLGSLFVY